VAGIQKQARVLKRIGGLLFVAVATLAIQFPAGAQTKQQEPARPKEETGPTVNVPARPDIARPGAAEVPASLAPVDPNAYIIGPEDVLFIRVWQEPNFTGPVLVRPDGMITLPLVRDLKAAGLTPSQLAEELVKRLGEYMKTKPDVTVFLQQVNSKRFFITGEVNRTGAFPLVKPTTVLEGLAECGGFRDFANKKKIIIVRGNKRLKYNYNEVIKGKKLEQNVLLEPGDQILVP
jgi:polysaccharide biosynthesis/export protein